MRYEIRDPLVGDLLDVARRIFSCNGCALEITGLTAPQYDLERFGIHFVAAPPELARARLRVLKNIIPDFPLCNKSFNLSYSGNDL